MGLFSQNAKASVDPIAKAIARYQSARSNIIILVALTVINIVIMLTGSFTYFLFSACVPYFLVDIGMIFCGKYPAEYYEGYMLPSDFFGDEFLAIMGVLAAIILAFYAFFYFRTKKISVGFMVATLVFFILDTAVMVMFYGGDLDAFLDYAFHIYIIVAQVLGIRAASHLKKAEAAGEYHGEMSLFPTFGAPAAEAPVNADVADGAASEMQEPAEEASGEAAEEAAEKAVEEASSDAGTDQVFH